MSDRSSNVAVIWAFHLIKRGTLGIKKSAFYSLEVMLFSSLLIVGEKEQLLAKHRI